MFLCSTNTDGDARPIFASVMPRRCPMGVNQYNWAEIASVGVEPARYLARRFEFEMSACLQAHAAYSADSELLETLVELGDLAGSIN